jgi:hypothetical protein
MYHASVWDGVHKHNMWYLAVEGSRTQCSRDPVPRKGCHKNVEDSKWKVSAANWPQSENVEHFVLQISASLGKNKQ